MITKILPAHIIRLYAWEVLKANTDLAEIDGYVPIIALEDEPKVSDAQKTYLIYGYSENNDPRLYELKRGTVSFRIKARLFGELGQITNALSRAFENCDISAYQVNQWASSNPDKIFKNIRFTSIEVVYVEGGSPEDSEGGPTDAVLNVAYECVIHDDTFTLPNNADTGLWAGVFN